MSRAARLPRPAGPAPIKTLLRLASGNVEVTDFMIENTSRYPRIAHVRLGLEHIYTINDASLIREFFVEHAHDVHKAPALKESNELLRNGLLTNEGDSWKRQRKLVQPGFHNARVRAYTQVMADVATTQRDAWVAGDTVDISADMSAATLSIIMRTLFGSDVDNRARELGDALNNVMHASSRWLLPFGPLLRFVPTQTNREAKTGTHLLQRCVQELIDDRRANGGGDDLLSMLLHAQDDETSATMNDAQLQDEIMTLILAGHETTAMALSWAWMLLAANRDTQQLLEAEVDAVLGDGKPAGFDHLPQLPYTRAVIAEALRLFPPAWIMGRKITNQIELDGWTIPRGSTVVVCPLAIQRDERFWTDPLAFDPSRWITDAGAFDDAAPGQPDGAWLPFGLGLRKCVGQVFAWTEAVVLLSMLATRWRPEIALPEPLQLTPAITLRPRHGMPARLVARL